MSGFVTCSWPGRGFAILFKFFGRIEFYDSQANFVRVAKVPFPSDGFVANEAGELVADFSGGHYQSCAVSGDKLLAGYSGTRFDDFEPGDPASYAVRRIHVFEWDGLLSREFELDLPVFAIAVGDGGQTLFATSLVTSSIYRFPLPHWDGER